MFGYPLLWLYMFLSRQQPIYRLAKLLADCQKDRRAWFLFPALQIPAVGFLGICSVEDGSFA
jgi:hypothetical protein